ncbi:MAG: HlyD family efflux transporter periplasmic adaptor subunit [Pseudomonadota bacterium]
MSMLGRLAMLPPVMLGAVLVWQALQSEPAPTVVAVGERRVPVSFVTAAPRALIPSVTGFGTVEPARIWTAVAQVAGPIDYMNPAFLRGGAVAAGDELVRIAAADYQLALDSAEADLSAAEARAEEMRASVRTTAASLEIEREMLEIAEADLARARRLAQTGAISDTVIDERRRDVLAQRAAIQNLENTQTLLPAQVEAQEQAARAARAARDAAALDLARTVVRAPFDARIASVDVEISQFVSAGTAMGVLDGAAAAEIDVQVPQGRMAALARLASTALAETGGASAPPLLSEAPTTLRPVPAADDGAVSVRAVRLEGARRLSAQVALAGIGTGTGIGAGTEGRDAALWPAEVVRISDAVDAETRSIGVIVRVSEPYAREPGDTRPPLIKGMFVRVALTAPPVSGVILLPRAAIRDGRVMLADAEDRLAYAAVDPVFTVDDIAVLAPGALPAGSRIVTSDPSPALQGLLLDAQPDLAAEARLTAAAHGGAL